MLRLSDSLSTAAHEINAEDDRHRTALAYARESDNKEIINILVKHGGTEVDYEHEAIKAIRKGDLARLEDLLKRGVLGSKSHYSFLLVIAAQEGNIEIANALLAKGADIEASGHLGTALHEAANYGHVDMIRFLAAR